MDLIKEIMPDIEEYFLLNNRGYIILEGYEWFRDIITLYAKQHQLVSATELLLDNNMNEEAFVLARSIITNYFQIGYLLNDKDGRRVKEYQVQPWLNERFKYKQMKKMLEGDFGKYLKDSNKEFPIEIKEINNKIKEIGKQIKEKGFNVDKPPISVLKMASQSVQYGFELYTLFYLEASKFEHSDIESLNIYKKAVEEISTNLAFIMDLNSTDTNIKDNIIKVISICYFDSFLQIVQVICNREPQLRINYDIEKLKVIVAKIELFLLQNNINV
nr:DUF5677 domain-containing protein [uncultured Clostridium sp.]